MNGWICRDHSVWSLQATSCGTCPSSCLLIATCRPRRLCYCVQDYDRVTLPGREQLLPNFSGAISISSSHVCYKRRFSIDARVSSLTGAKSSDRSPTSPLTEATLSNKCSSGDPLLFMFCCQSSFGVGQLSMRSDISLKAVSQEETESENQAKLSIRCMSKNDFRTSFPKADFSCRNVGSSQVLGRESTSDCRLVNLDAKDDVASAEEAEWEELELGKANFKRPSDVRIVR